jgi:hypothetical protein
MAARVNRLAGLAATLGAALTLTGCEDRSEPPSCQTSAECAAPTGARAECRDRRCVSVSQCGVELPCADPSYLCDAIADACYPPNGACTTAASCPNLRAEEGGAVTCDAGFCRLGSPHLRRLPGLAADAEVSVSSPLAGEQLASSEALVVRWSVAAGEDGALVFVLDQQPTTRASIAEHAIWGAAVPPGGTQSVSFAQGHSVSGTAWGAPVPLPDGEPLYVMVLVVRLDRLVAASAPVPFSIGAAWRAPGDPCDAAPGPVVVPGDCYSPATLMACVEGSCAVMCASHLDCAPFGLRCGALVDGVRACE